ncbi:MAG: exonuclease subunit SbcD [Clostridia bacterium]|nr:exonuclease subunit SbcD [Clostridia bacterium]
MRILHTSDWHIGKKLMGRDRYDEYRSVLSEISDICEREKIELVLVAGDVFDTYTPSAEAEQIFYEGVKKISQNCAVVIISGNHDDYVRLTAASSFASELNIYIVGNNSCKVSDNTSRFNVKPVECDYGYAVFEGRQGDKVYINILPYPNEARFKEGKSEERFEDKMSRWINFGERGKRKSIPSIFLSHIFVVGGKVSDGEREIELGGTRLVSHEMLPKCDYCALGHLHRSQKIGENVYYSGAIMQFTFDEAGAEKYVNVFDLDSAGVKNFKKIVLTSSRKLVRLQSNGAEEGIRLLKENTENYVELTLNLTEPLNPTQSAALHSHENLVSLKANVALADGANLRVSNKDKSSSQLFTEYYKTKFDCEPSKELLELFLSLAEEE